MHFLPTTDKFNSKLYRLRYKYRRNIEIFGNDIFFLWISLYLDVELFWSTWGSSYWFSLVNTCYKPRLLLDSFNVGGCDQKNWSDPSWRFNYWYWVHLKWYGLNITLVFTNGGCDEFRRIGEPFETKFNMITFEVEGRIQCTLSETPGKILSIHFRRIEHHRRRCWSIEPEYRSNEMPLSNIQSIDSTKWTFNSNIR